MSFRVRTDSGMSNEIRPVVGVRQGCILSPLLFNIFLEYILRLLDTLPMDEGVRMGNVLMEILGYADDIALTAYSLGELQSRLKEMDDTFLAAGMEISLDKTEVMVSNYEERRRIILRGKTLSNVDSFAYLGMIQDKNAGSELAIEKRMEKASKAFGMLTSLWRSKIRWQIKGMMYVTMVRSILLYGASTWTTKADDFRALEVFEAGCVRRILKVSRLEHVATDTLRERLGIASNTREEVAKCRIRLFRHAFSSSEETLLRTAIEAELEDPVKGRPGRPVKRWINSVEGDIKDYGFGLYTARGLATKMTKQEFETKMCLKKEHISKSNEQSGKESP